MIGIAYDYSAGFPGAVYIKRSGALGAVRYIGQPGNRKNTTRAELLDFQASPENQVINGVSLCRDAARR